MREPAVCKSLSLRLSRTCGTSSCNFVQRMAADERGVTAVIFGIMFSALFFLVALSLDYMGATRERQRQQAAIDAAALAGSHYLGLENEDIEGPEAAKRFFRENMGEASKPISKSRSMETTVRCRPQRTTNI